jgi:hypothetical protein
MPPSTHRPRLTVGLRQGSRPATPDLKAALASGPLSLADLAAKAGHSVPVTAAAVRGQPGAFREAGGLVHLV